MNRRVALGLVLAGLSISCFLGFWYWATHVHLAANIAEGRARKIPVGNNSDLYPRWLGARELLLHGRNPYSSEITREIQIGFYGRPLNPDDKSDPTDKEGFAYPLWVVFVLAPTVKLRFAMTARIFRWVLLVSLAGTVPLWFYVMGLRRRSWVLFCGIVLALSSLPALLEYYQQNLTALSVCIVAAAFVCAVRGWLVLGGFLLALSTIKPDTCFFLVLWLIVWALARWPERQRLIWAFVVTMGILLAFSEALLHGSTLQFIAAVREYRTYAGTLNLLQRMFGQRLGIALSALLLFVLFLLWSRWRPAEATTSEFKYAIAWTCVVTLAIIPKMADYNTVLLIPPLLLLAAQFPVVQRRTILARALLTAPLACLLLHWLATAGLSLCTLLSRVSLTLPTAEIPINIFHAVLPLTLLAVLTVTFVSATGDRTLHRGEAR